VIWGGWGEATARNSRTTGQKLLAGGSEGEKLHTFQWEVDCAEGKSDAATPNEAARAYIICKRMLLRKYISVSTFKFHLTF
jgi:hypothetical protein